MEVPPKTKNRVAMGSGNDTPEHISRENSNSKRWMHLNVQNNSIYNSQDMEATKWPSIDKWIIRDVVYIMEYYSAIKIMK